MGIDVCDKDYFMQIEKVHLADYRDTGGSFIIVIDVLRAFTTAAYAFGSGADEILLVGTAEEAMALKDQDPQLLLVGEDGGQMIPGFDFDNSPSRMSRADISGKKLVLRTSCGTQGVVRCKNAEHLLTGSFPVAEATLREIQRTAPEKVTFIITGTPTGEEDWAFADYMEDRLKGNKTFAEPYLQRVLRTHDAMSMLSKSNCPLTYLDDMHAAIQIDRFPFAMRVYNGNCLRVQTQTQNR